MFVSLVFLW